MPVLALAKTRELEYPGEATFPRVSDRDRDIGSGSFLPWRFVRAQGSFEVEQRQI